MRKPLKYFLFAIIYFVVTVLTDLALGHGIDWLGALFISIILSLVVITVIDLIDKNKEESKKEE